MPVPFPLYFSWKWRRYCLASCDSSDRSLQVNSCFGWTDCWCLVLLVLSLKDRFIARNLSGTWCAGFFTFFLQKACVKASRGPGEYFKLQQKGGNCISALDCAAPLHPWVQGWKVIILQDVVEFTVDWVIKVSKDPLVCWSGCVSPGNCV